MCMYLFILFVCVYLFPDLLVRVKVRQDVHLAAVALVHSTTIIMITIIIIISM